MVMEKHTCPYGLKALDLLKRQGLEVEDRWLTTREETDAFKAEQGVKTTPQVFIDGVRVGGYDDTRRYFGKSVPDPKATTYKPVIAIFGMSALMGLAISTAALGTPFTARAVEWFIAVAMCLLAVQKLQNVESFATMFLNYDLLANAGCPIPISTPSPKAGRRPDAGRGADMAFRAGRVLIGTVGAVSVFKAVYLDRRELKCACVGGSSNVPLGFVSLTENLMMIGMALWMGVHAFSLIRRRPCPARARRSARPPGRAWNRR